MTFWERFYNLCEMNGTKPNSVAKELGFSNATCTKWKNGSEPSGKSLSLIAEYFQVSTDYLLGNEMEKEAPLDKTDQEILVLARKSQELPEEDKKKFLEILRGSVNAFFKESDNK